MEYKAYIKNVRISPKKLRFFLPAVKKLKPVDALDYLFYLPNKGAKILYKSIKSAIDNAKNLSKSDINLLKFKLLTVEEGFSFKRFRPGGRGTIKPYKKRTSHIKIILTDQEEVKDNLKIKEEKVSEKEKKLKIKKEEKIKKKVK